MRYIMALTITTLDSTKEKAWDDLVVSSTFGTLFHTVEWLKLVQKQTNAEYLPLMFYNRSQLVAIYPIFVQKKGLVKVALSPPSRSYMLYLGPVIADYESMKQDKKESTYIRVQQEMDNYIFKIKGCKYARIRSSPGLYDSRPLRWSGYSVEPLYTYRIDLTQGIDHIWEQFDRKLRVEINKAVREGVKVRSGNLNDLEFIHDSLFTRYTKQGISPVDYKKFLQDLYQKFYPDNLKIFVAEYNGKRIGGTINLVFKNGMYLWVGLPKTDLVGISANDLVQWEAIKWSQKNGLEYYEEMDAGDDPRLRYFKSKYNPELVIWYAATKYSSFIYKIGEKIFQMLS
jgi:lipid II:glycine glycyltransferase (peptidoglycan interpeptide bridge formation enzyme)